MKNFWLKHRNDQLKLESKKHEIQRLKNIVFQTLTETFADLTDLTVEDARGIQERVILWRLAVEYSQNSEYYRFVSMLPRHLMASYLQQHWNGANFRGLGLIHQE